MTFSTDLTGQVAIVTGSGSGIGRATADALRRHGAHVAGFDVSPEQQPLPSEAGNAGGEWLPVRVDVSAGDGVRAAVGQVLDRFGRVDVLVTSAAVAVAEPFLEIREETWDRVLAVNVKGAMLSAQAVLPSMVERGSGRVVVVSSIAGRTKSVVNGAHYTCSKYGLIGLVRHLTAELAGTGVRINCLAPGPTNTPFLDASSTSEERDAIRAKTPLRRLAEPEDVADAALFLATDQSRHVHGAVLDVNGGLY